jgi:type II secretory pathway pseudopilin PulG
VAQNQLAYTKLMRETRALMAVNERGCVSPAKCAAAPKLVEDLLGNGGRSVCWLLYDKPAKQMLAAIAIPNCSRAMQTAARNQTRVNLALVACALERHRLAHGEYPATLAARAPEFLAQLPHDLIGGAPLKYQRTTDGKFLLYSIGWNETDDGGKISRDKDGKVNASALDGDWVWAGSRRRRTPGCAVGAK